MRSLQESALGIYGRLEPDRALVWTTEELGELAQAVRRAEGPARMEEELGQLRAWMLCLATFWAWTLRSRWNRRSARRLTGSWASTASSGPTRPDG
jgi:MazG-like nucleotide pyrophosphohydrolase family protein